MAKGDSGSNNNEIANLGNLSTMRAVGGFSNTGQASPMSDPMQQMAQSAAGPAAQLGMMNNRGSGTPLNNSMPMPTMRFNPSQFPQNNIFQRQLTSGNLPMPPQNNSGFMGGSQAMQDYNKNGLAMGGQGINSNVLAQILAQISGMNKTPWG